MLIFSKVVFHFVYSHQQLCTAVSREQSDPNKPNWSCFVEKFMFFNQVYYELMP